MWTWKDFRLSLNSASKKDELTISGNDGDDAKKYQELDVRNILKKLQEAQRK